MPTRRPKPVVLCVLDGWGHRPEPAADNAIVQARTPHLDSMAKRWPVSVLQASEGHVGLPAGQMGNSEVGHMNLGAGRVVMQDLPRIDQAVADGALAGLPALTDLIARLKASGGVCHLMGLVSPGGVHSHQDHMSALAVALDRAGIRVRVHAFLDGRDTPPSSAEGYLRGFVARLGAVRQVAIATLCGRFFAMDRDKRWDRVAEAYAALTEGRGHSAAGWQSGLQAAYGRGETDEFVKPTVVAGYAGMADGDAVLMANFRADRAREILSALLEPGFEEFSRTRIVRFAAAVGMCSYSTRLDALMATLFPPTALSHSLGEVVAAAGLRQLRIAETEKYAHVTFFFNGGEEATFPGEDRILVPSPKVKTYDLKPEMSAYEVTDRLVEAISAGTYDFIVVNYANGDMVGHTGKLTAAVKAVEAVDACMGRLADAVIGAGGVLLITADHGNAEQMSDRETGQAHTAHTLNPVPAMLINADGVTALADGRLSDVAPTLLQLLGLPQPAEMTGHSLARLGAERAVRPAIAAAGGLGAP